MIRRVLALGGAAVAVLGLCVVGGLVFLARSDRCEGLPREDLSLREMGDLRHLLDAYKRKGDQLSLSERQASFLVREEFGVPAWLEVQGRGLRVEARIGGGAGAPPDSGSPTDAVGAGCWNVTYRGGFEVTDGRAYVSPEVLRIGRLELGGWFGSRRVELPSSVIAAGGPKFVELMAHLETLEVGDDVVSVRFDDPSWIR